MAVRVCGPSLGASRVALATLLAAAKEHRKLRVAETTFRRLNARHLLAAVAAGAKYADGIAVTPHAERVAA